jgi:hypothetical protein
MSVVKIKSSLLIYSKEWRNIPAGPAAHNAGNSTYYSADPGFLPVYQLHFRYLLFFLHQQDVQMQRYR